MTVARATYRDILRSYADKLRSGHTDTDLTPRQRRLAAVLVITASNDSRATCEYPPREDTRSDITKALGDDLWGANYHALLGAISPSAAHDGAEALQRALEVIRGV